MSNRVVTIALATVLVAVFLYEIAAGAAGNEVALLPLGALRTRGWSRADWWRVLTFSFLHLNLLHLLLNVAGVLWLGGIIERRLGPALLVILFVMTATMSGLAAILLGDWLPTTGIAIGASGVVCGFLAAALLLVFGYRARRGTQDQVLRRALVIFFITAIAISFLPGVSFAGHLGGFIAGALITPLMVRWRERYHRMLGHTP
jgi:membrane associated rhomboid family serine protease